MSPYLMMPPIVTCPPPPAPPTGESSKDYDYFVFKMTKFIFFSVFSECCMKEMSFHVSFYHLLCAQVDAVKHHLKVKGQTDLILQDLLLACLEVAI